MDGELRARKRLRRIEGSSSSDEETVASSGHSAHMERSGKKPCRPQQATTQEHALEVVVLDSVSVTEREREKGRERGLSPKFYSSTRPLLSETL
jgi:hypothetical protein